MDTTVSESPSGTEPIVNVMPDAELVPLAQGIDIAPFIRVSNSLGVFRANAEDFAGQCSRAEIADAQSYQAGNDLLQFASAQLKQLEAYRKSVKQPIDDYAALIQSVFKPIKEQFEKARDELSKKMLAWRNEQERIERERVEAARKAAEEEALRIAAKAEESGNTMGANALLDAVANAKVNVQKVVPPSLMGRSATKRTYWTGSVHDPMQILKEIVAGNLPIHIVEFSPSGLNKIANEIRVEGVSRGIKITKSETLR